MPSSRPLRPHRLRRPRHNPIPLRDPDSELTALIQPSPTFPSPSNPSHPMPESHLDEAGFIEQSLGNFVSADRTLLRAPEEPEEVVMVQTSGDAVLVEVEEEDEEGPVLVSGRASPATSFGSPGSSGGVSLRSAFSSVANSIRESRRGSMASAKSSKSSKSPVPTKVQETGEESDSDALEIIDDYFAKPVYRGGRRLNPNVFFPPPEGKSEFEGEDDSDSEDYENVAE